MHIVFICVELILLGGPHAFPSISPLLGQVMFWSGIFGLVLYPCLLLWRNREGFHGWVSSPWRWRLRVPWESVQSSAGGPPIVAAVLSAPNQLSPIPLAPSKLPPFEVERRLALLDEAYDVLKNDFEPMLDFASRLQNTWASELELGGPQKLRRTLKEIQIRIGQCSEKLWLVQKRCDLCKDIEALLEQDYQKHLSEAIGQTRRAAEKLPDPLSGDWKFFFQPYIDAYYQGIVAIAQWTHATKAKIASARDDYLKRIA